MPTKAQILQKRIRLAKNIGWVAKKTPFTDFTKDKKIAMLGCIASPKETSFKERAVKAKSALAAHLKLMSDNPAVYKQKTSGAPQTFDWRNVHGRNFIDPIRDQGQCGSCVSHATAAGLEANARIHNDLAVNDTTSIPLDLSEAYLHFCAAGRKCDQGWYVDNALDVAKKNGVPSEECYSYQAKDQSCSVCNNWRDQVTQIFKYQSINSVYLMKAWLSERGPLVTRFDVYDDFFDYSSGVYRYVDGDRAGGHAVLCIGYCDTRKAWLCKNSWGTGFGESGYFWIGYGECGIDESMYAIDGFKKISGLPVRPFLEWWEEKDYKGARHVKYLSNFALDVCHRLVHNDRMKSLKFHASPGWRLKIFDDSGCKTSDDWAEVTFPNDQNVKVVCVPKIGKLGVTQVTPAGCYKLHRKNGLLGKVSAIRIYKDEKRGTLVWWEGKNYTGRKHTRYLNPSEHGKCLVLVNQDKMKSLKLYAFPGWKLELYDKSSCDRGDDWGEVMFPNNSSVSVVELPKIGKNGESQVKPAGCYKLHKKQGLPGQVSSIKHFGP
ncbi:MAG: C1 family peptidase [Gammaproteobacteria bacterium]|nr:C1 family peptidase [Gammaproteobacteria bacterium]MDH5802220.1 C1 family peptidase [Gammaproteobacteria bacterium]